MAIPEITAVIRAIPAPGHRGTDIRETFVTKQEAYQDHQVTELRDDLTNMINQQNAVVAATNVVSESIVGNAQSIYSAAAIAQVTANYVGDWVAGFNTTGYSIGETVSYTAGNYYISKLDTNLVEPTSGTSTNEWEYFNPFVVKDNPVFTGAVTEQTFVNTTGELNPNNGTIQQIVLSSNFILSDVIAEGQSLTLIVKNGSSFVLTYPALIEWSGVIAPVLGSSDILVFFKAFGTLYGTHIGSTG